MKKTWLFVSLLFFIGTSSACFSSKVDKCVSDDECEAGQACIDNRCFPFLCGDGILNVGEDCDAGEHNGAEGSSCPINCLLDDACGNGAVEGDEACDDKNLTDDDGCSALCAVELGYLCSGQPSACVLSCGDGIINGNDACEDTFEGNGSCENCQIVCDTGYAGTSCSSCAQGYQDENEDGTCLASCDIAVLTCSGHGSCAISEAGQVECVCDTGYTGTNCSDCASGYQDGNEDGTCLADCTLVDLDCSGNGECGINASGETACACYTGYEGESCDACVTGYINCGEGCAPGCTDSETCNGHGECNEEVCQSPACTCTDNWTSSNCTSCSEGYAGSNCEDCATGYKSYAGACVKSCDYPNVCNGHGVCDENSGAAQCTCGGYCIGGAESAGTFCDGETLCTQGGTCQTRFTGTYCDTCITGYSGTDCRTCAAGYHDSSGASPVCCLDGEQDTNADGVCEGECGTNTCNEDNGGGTCDDASGSVVCTCSSHFTGARCDTCLTAYIGDDCTACVAGYQDYDGDGDCAYGCFYWDIEDGAGWLSSYSAWTSGNAIPGPWACDADDEHPGMGSCDDSSGAVQITCNTGYAQGGSFSCCETTTCGDGIIAEAQPGGGYCSGGSEPADTYCDATTTCNQGGTCSGQGTLPAVEICEPNVAQHAAPYDGTGPACLALTSTNPYCDDTDCKSQNGCCGDGVRQETAGEGCDDGNLDASDGCFECAEEEGWSCEENESGLSTCSAPECGDGSVNAGEECDDNDSNPTYHASLVCNGCLLSCADTNNTYDCNDDLSDGCEYDLWVRHVNAVDEDNTEGFIYAASGLVAGEQMLFVAGYVTEGAVQICDAGENVNQPCTVATQATDCPSGVCTTLDLDRTTPNPDESQHLFLGAYMQDGALAWARSLTSINTVDGYTPEESIHDMTFHNGVLYVVGHYCDDSDGQNDCKLIYTNLDDGSEDNLESDEDNDHAQAFILKVDAATGDLATTEGSFISSYGGGNNSCDSFTMARAIAVDDNDNMYVAGTFQTPEDDSGGCAVPTAEGGIFEHALFDGDVDALGGVVPFDKEYIYVVRIGADGDADGVWQTGGSADYFEVHDIVVLSEKVCVGDDAGAQDSCDTDDDCEDSNTCIPLLGLTGNYEDGTFSWYHDDVQATSVDASTRDMFLITLEASFEYAWVQTLSEAGTEYATDLVLSQDGSLFVGGYYLNSSASYGQSATFLDCTNTQMPYGSGNSGNGVTDTHGFVSKFTYNAVTHLWSCAWGNNIVHGNTNTFWAMGEPSFALVEGERYPNSIVLAGWYQCDDGACAIGGETGTGLRVRSQNTDSQSPEIYSGQTDGLDGFVVHYDANGNARVMRKTEGAANTLLSGVVNRDGGVSAVGAFVRQSETDKTVTFPLGIGASINDVELEEGNENSDAFMWRFVLEP